jgi:hypothetical protein
VWFWLGATVALPVVTVATQGFLGYGFAAMMVVFTFVAAFYRPRWQTLAVGLVLGYVGLSVFVTYMRDRGEIRRAVWGGASVVDRADRLTDTFSHADWFHLSDTKQLDLIDSRLNQTYFVGAAADYINHGHVPFAYGGTVVDAMLAIVPRAIWPDKPVSAGSGDLVTKYTGFEFMEGTSVGVGQVLEAYVNFGTTGVVVGFLLIGGLIALVDLQARAALNRGDLPGLALWYLPGLSLLQVGGSLVEVTATAASAYLVARLLGQVARRQSRRRPAVVIVGAES